MLLEGDACARQDLNKKANELPRLFARKAVN